MHPQESGRKEGGSLKRREGLTSREDLQVVVRGFGASTGVGDRACATVLVPYAGAATFLRRPRFMVLQLLARAPGRTPGPVG